MKKYVLMLLVFVFISACESGPAYVKFEMDTVAQNGILGKWQLVGTKFEFSDSYPYIEYSGDNKYIEFTKNMAGSYGDCVSNMNSEDLHLYYMVTWAPVIFFYTSPPEISLEDYQYKGAIYNETFTNLGVYITDTLCLRFYAVDRWFDDNSENTIYYFKKIEE